MTAVPAATIHAWRDPDGAGVIGPDQHMPVNPGTPFGEVMNGLNPIHYVPVVGMLYRVATGEQIPATMRVLGALATGGPLGALGAGLSGLLEHILTLEPDQTRPRLPSGMAMNDAGMAPPDPTEKDGYTTLATVLPDWLGPQRLQAAGTAYAAAGEWDRAQRVERGVA